jgi:hypothetical protein
LIPSVSADIRQAIEAVLNDQWPYEWRPARDGETLPAQEGNGACWRLDASTGEHGHKYVDFVWLCVDGDFPLSRMRIYAPGTQEPSALPWPHVEDAGRLCLGNLPLDIESHVRFSVKDAFDILGMDGVERANEFAREFIPYWDRHVGKKLTEARSLILPGGQSRPIVWAPWGKSFMFAEDEATIEHWFEQGGYRLDTVRHTRLIRLDRAPAPDTYPNTGADIFALDPLVRNLCETRDPLPVLLEVPTPAMVQVAVAIQPAVVPGLRTNRRHPVRKERRDAVFGPAPVSRVAVMRQDHAWVHGRDHNKSAAKLAQMCVGIIGCGALGSEVTRLLAAAGIGQFVLVDRELLVSANTTRHALGATYVGQWKAKALAKAMGRQFPHLAKAVTHHHAFESLKTEALHKLACCSLIMAAGVDDLAIARIVRWRDSLNDPPPLIIAWVEEFACAGHEMLLSPGLTAETFLDDARRPRSNLTSNWPTAMANVVPAGCGSSFQPYTTTDMLGTVQTTTRLVLDALLGIAQAPLHRIWLGDRHVPEKLGATISELFDDSFKEIDAP